MSDYKEIGGGDLDWHTTVVPLGVGVVLGGALAKSLWFLPSVVMPQFAFKNWIVSKMFLSALTTSLVLTAILSATKKNDSGYGRNKSRKGLLSAGLGAACIGIGMAVCGSDPLAVYPQMGSGILGAVWVFCGGLLGACTYLLLADQWQKLDDVFRLDRSLLDEYIKIPYWTISLVVAACTGVGCFFLEQQHPWTDDLPSGMPTPPDNDWKGYLPTLKTCWHPFTSGVIFGTMQLVLKGLVGVGISSTASYTAPVSLVVTWVADKLNISIPSGMRQTELKSLWCAFMMLGAAGGGALAASLTNMEAYEKGMPLTWGLGAGFFLVFGACMAGGCAWGHGMTGITDLRLQSFVATAAMFATSIGTGMLMHHEDLHPSKDGYVY